jgi:uncharacterized protein (DUF362 family)
MGDTMPSRREFIIGTGASLVAASIAQPFKAAMAVTKTKLPTGRVVQIGHAQMTKNDRPVQEIAEQMLSRGMTEFTGKKKPEDAWASLFNANDLVGIKINCLGKPKMSTTPEVVKAIIAGLKSAGVKEERIVVFDLFGSHMTMSRFRLQTSEQGVRYISNKHWGYEEEWRNHPSGKVKFTKILLKADKIISVPVIKDHALSGVTCALKNMAFGTIINPSAHHRGGCNPGVPNIYNLSPIKDKVALIVCDAAFMQYDGGPQSKPSARLPMNTLFLTQDPVAMDTLAWEHIDTHRKAKRLPLLAKSRKPVHIATAAGLGLGTDDRSKIKVTKVQL